MLFDLIMSLLGAFKWLILGTFIMAGLGLVFVGIPALVAERKHNLYLQTKAQIRAEKEMEAHKRTFYNQEEDEFTDVSTDGFREIPDHEFFAMVQTQVFGEKIEEPFQNQEARIFDTSIDAVLRAEAREFLRNEPQIFLTDEEMLSQRPTLFEEKIGEGIGTHQPNLLRDSYTTFFKNADGNTDGFQQLP